jgi:hypothetical protein
LATLIQEETDDRSVWQSLFADKLSGLRTYGCVWRHAQLQQAAARAVLGQSTSG